MTQIAGTPGYLAPEQARGEPSTTASDIWSFALLLLELLTGERPFPRGATSRELVARAQRGQATVPAGLPRAETRLLQRMLTADPAERPSARAVREELLRIADRPKRRIRRALVASMLLLSLAAGLKYTVDLRGEREAALAAQHRAEQARGEAEGLASFMLIELYTELKKVGKLPLLEPVALKASGYYGDFGDDPDRGGRGERALALIRVAEVLDMQGHLAEATEVYRKAVMGLAPLAKGYPDDELIRYRLALAERNLGEVLRFGGDYIGGDPHALRAVELARTLTAGLEPGLGPDESPTGAERWSLLLRGLYLYADSRLRQGQAAEALRLLDEAAELARPAVARQAALRRDLGDIQYKRCMALFDSQAAERVVSACQASFALDKALHDENPDDFALRRNLMTAYWMLGRAQQMAGQLDAALASTLTGERLARQLAADAPGNIESLNSIAVQLVSRARILRELGDAKADAVLDEVLRLTSPILAEGEDHAAMHNHLTALAMLGRIEEARPYARIIYDSGWRRPEFLKLVVDLDLLPGVDLAAAGNR